MQYIHRPTKITKRIYYIQRNLIWRTTSTKNKLHMTYWKVVAKSKKDGGIGAQQSETKNKAQLAKLAWL